jgi:hypothetical protein
MEREEMLFDLKTNPAFRVSNIQNLGYDGQF